MSLFYTLKTKLDSNPIYVRFHAKFIHSSTGEREMSIAQDETFPHNAAGTFPSVISKTVLSY